MIEIKIEKNSYETKDISKADMLTISVTLGVARGIERFFLMQDDSGGLCWRR